MLKNLALKYLYVILLSAISIAISGQEKTNPISQPQELGAVSWFRDYDIALNEAKKLDKPVLILFQEVPGCATCKNYGDNVLSHPLIKDVIETEFVPLVIYNNKGGQDKKILEKYNEPSWNNPVIRIVDENGENITNRFNNAFSLSEVGIGLVAALQTAGQVVPQYLNLLSDELITKRFGAKEIYYQMYCFWTGEAKFGNIDGVVSTSPGFMNGKEVVKVTYRENQVSKKDIDKIAKINQFSFVNDPSTFKIDKDPQYYLKKSIYRFLPLLETQRTRINSSLAAGENADLFLSPFQLEFLKKVKSEKSKNFKAVYNLDFSKAYTLIYD